MTVQTAHGYSDWGRFQAQADIEYYDDAPVNVDAVTNYGPFFVGDVPFIALRFDPLILSHKAELRFFSEVGAVNFFGSYEWHVRNGANVHQSVAVLGSWVQLRVTPSAAGSSFQARIVSAPTAGRIPGLGVNATALIQVSASAIAIGATNQAVAGNVWPGEAVWSVRTSLATFEAYLEVDDYLNVSTIIDAFTETAVDRSRTVYLPAGRMRIRIVNTSGGAGTVYYYLNANSRLLAG